MEKVLSFIGTTLYSMRIMMSIFYIGLVALIVGILYKFLTELSKVPAFIFNDTVTKTDVVIKSLELVDMVMVAQLVWVVAIAGVSLFVTSKHFDDNPSLKKPDWLDHVNTYNLKLKLAFAIISISGVHALKSYLSYSMGTGSIQQLVGISMVHLFFVLCAVGIAYSERLTRE